MPQNSICFMPQEVNKSANPTKEKLIFVTDKKSYLILSNTKAALSIGVPMEQLLHLNTQFPTSGQFQSILSGNVRNGKTDFTAQLRL